MAATNHSGHWTKYREYTCTVEWADFLLFQDFRNLTSGSRLRSTGALGSTKINLKIKFILTSSFYFLLQGLKVKKKYILLGKLFEVSEVIEEEREMNASRPSDRLYISQEVDT